MEPSRILRSITQDGSFMATAMDSTQLVCVAQEIHRTSPVATAALGRLLTASSLMGNLLKKPGASITLKIKGGGPLGVVVAVADSRADAAAMWKIQRYRPRCVRTGSWMWAAWSVTTARCA